MKKSGSNQMPQSNYVGRIKQKQEAVQRHCGCNIPLQNHIVRGGVIVSQTLCSKGDHVLQTKLFKGVGVLCSSNHLLQGDGGVMSSVWRT